MNLSAPMRVSDDLEWVPVAPLPGARRTWVLSRKDGGEVELEDFEEC